VCVTNIHEERAKERTSKNDAQRDVPEQEPEHQKHQHGHQYRRWVHIFFLKQVRLYFCRQLENFFLILSRAPKKTSQS